MEDVFKTGDEVEELARAFAEKERIEAELSLATHIQESMLPHIVPAFPDRKDFDILGSMDPAKEVGGFFYKAEQQSTTSIGASAPHGCG